MKMIIPRALIDDKTIRAIFETNDDASIVASLSEETIMDMGWLYYVKETTLEKQVAAIRKSIGVFSEKVKEVDQPEVKEESYFTNPNDTRGKPVISFIESPKSTKDNIGELLCETEVLDNVVVHLYNAGYDAIEIKVLDEGVEVYKEVVPKYEDGWMDFGVDEIGSGVALDGTSYVSFAVYEYHNSGTQIRDVSMIIPKGEYAQSTDCSEWDTNTRKPVALFSEERQRFLWK